MVLLASLLINFAFAQWTISPDWTVSPDWTYEGYILSLVVSDPDNITYTTPSIPVSLSVTGTDSNPVYSWNFQFANASWLYVTNKTTTSDTMTLNENLTGTFCCHVIGDHLAEDYAEVVFTVELHKLTVDLSTSITSSWVELIKWAITITFSQPLTSTWNFIIKSTFNIASGLSSIFSWVFGAQYSSYGISIYIVSPANATYSAGSFPIQFNTVTGGTIDEQWWNIKNGTSWVYPTNQTYTGATTATGFINGASYTFTAGANNTVGVSAEASVKFSIVIPFYLTMNSPTSGGIVNPVAGTYNYTAGTNVSLIATANPGYSFVAWELNGVNETTTQTIWSVIMDANHTAKAYFKVNTYAILTSIDGFGSITRNVSEPYTYGQNVQLTAVPAPMQQFTSWGGDLAGPINPKNIVMTSNRSVSASFIALSSILSVSLVDPMDTQVIDAFTVNFMYYPLSRYDSITGSSLWINGTQAATNTTTVSNATLNGYQHTFASNGTYLWNVLVSNSSTSVFALLNRTVTIAVYEPSTVAPSQPANFYFLHTTHTINNVTGYNIALTSGWVNATVGGQGVPETAITQYGFKAWLVHNDGVADCLTGADVVGIITRETGGQGMQNATVGIPTVTLVMGMNAIKVSIYVRFDYGEWYVINNYISDLLVKKGIVGGVWTLNLYTKVVQSGGETYAYIYWGNQMCLSGLGGVTFVEPLPQEIALNYANSGDFYGMIMFPYLYLLGDLFYGVALLFVGSVLYVRHRRFEVILILFLLFGGTSGFGLLIPNVAYRLIYVILLFILASIMYRLVR